MKKFILNSPPDSGGMVHLTGKDFHYLARVRRIKAGSVFTAVLPNGNETELMVISVDDDILKAAVTVAPDRDSPSFIPLYLFQALPKGAKMDLIVRQAAEAGILEIVPFVSEYTQVKRNAVDASGKAKRWERIIKEARQQSGSTVQTTVGETLCIDEILDYWDKLKNERQGAGIILHQDPLAPGSFHDYLDNDPEFAVLAIGPEGGFSRAEADRFVARGFKPLCMGKNVLRTETAALYGAAAIQIIISERETWLLKKNLNQ